ncbi:MAG: TIM-barrel domain-containing protein [Muribaculaceae bacterium]
MKQNLFLTAIMLLGSIFASSAKEKNIAYCDEQVRFTVITDGTVRLEYAPDGAFTDNKSLIAVVRDYDVKSNFKVKVGSWIEITTPLLRLRYKKGSGAFNEKNLTITSASKKKGSFQFAWKPGKKQTANLKGTFRTLDNYNGDVRIKDTAEGKKGEKMEIEDGILARDGWTLIDDSKGLLFDGSADWDWVTERKSTDGQDWYFMAYGTDYKRALKDYATFAGKMPLPPRYAFGYWWSRWWMYSDTELRQLVDGLRNYGFPLDVLVLDMDWHYTDKNRGGWTGWTWNRELYPNYKGLLKDLNDDHLKVTLNVHPAKGVAWFEEKYPEMARAMGMNPDPAAKDTVTFLASDKKLMTNLFDIILNPMMNDGVGFWWLDWQQHIYDKSLTSLKNTWWISRCFFTDMQLKTDRRPIIYHRWSGLGNHRYQVGFSGDASISWETLTFQPYFNSTASNVLYGYWSHDIGGFRGDSINPEMHARWMQFGALSGIMRTHSTKKTSLNKEPWAFTKEYCDIYRNAVRQRYTMAPYIYAMARRGYDDALALCRPMYYDYPTAEEAYSFRNEYMFGDNMLVSPITTPMNGHFSVQTTWLPAGNWFEVSSGSMVEGGGIVERKYAIDEYPLFVKAGSILPFYNNKVQNLQGNNEEVVVTVFPGNEGGDFTMYEDNGDDQNYATEYATTALSSRIDGNTQTITIGARHGSYKDMPARRRFSVKLLNRFAPTSVTVNGSNVDCRYCGEDMAVIIDIPVTDCSVEKVVKITYPATSVSLDGLKGISHRLEKALGVVKYNKARITFKREFTLLGSLAASMYYAREDQPEIVREFINNYNNIDEVVKKQKLNDAQKELFFNSIDWHEIKQ